MFRLVTTSIVEERILARATDKRNLNGLVVEAGKFTNKDESESNKAMVESMLNEWSAGGAGGGEGGGVEGGEEGEIEEEVEAEVPDDDQINEMMSTHDNEMIIYETMDRERHIMKEKQLAELNKKLPKGSIPLSMPSALMGALEKPSWLLASSWSHKHSQLDQIMMGNGDGTFIPKKKGQKGRKRKLDGEPGGEEDEDDEEDDEGVMVAGKLMRKRKEAVAYDDHLTDKQFLRQVEMNAEKEEQMEIKEKQDRRQPAASKEIKESSLGLVPKAQKFSEGGMADNVNATVLKAVKEVSKLQREDGSLRAALFLEKPDRKIYPDYYLLVPRPIGFKVYSHASFRYFAYI